MADERLCKALEFIKNYIKRYGYPPIYQEIGNILGVCAMTAFNLLKNHRSKIGDRSRMKRVACSSNEYFTVHAWLIRHFGKATRCDNKLCTNKSAKTFHWALKKGCEHKKDPDNYIWMCCSCHIKYDMTDERRKQMSDAIKGRPGPNRTPVIAIKGNDILEFPYITFAAVSLGIRSTAIHNCLAGRTKTTAGYIWKYKTPKTI